VVKLFPGFLFIYFVVQRRWRVVWAGLATVAGLTLVTAAALGPDCYRVYCSESLPRVAEFRGCWSGLSVPGFWCRLFDPGARAGAVAPAFYCPALANTGAVVSVALLTGLLGRVVRRARTREETDQAFGLAVVVMLLASPITWDHSLVILLLPLAIMWARLPAGRLAVTFWALVSVLSVGAGTFYWGESMRGAKKAPTPFQVVSNLSVQTYALAGVFGLGVVLLKRGGRRRTEAIGKGGGGVAGVMRLGLTRPLAERDRRRIREVNAWIGESADA
jgi:hypothetical protein